MSHGYLYSIFFVIRDSDVLDDCFKIRTLQFFLAFKYMFRPWKDNDVLDKLDYIIII